MKHYLYACATLFVAVTAVAETPVLPEPTSDRFCQVVQKILSNTELDSYNIVFPVMDDYRASKPSPRPLITYQIVQYDGQMPVMVSCKVKGAAHIREFKGEDSAGEQLFCPTITRMLQTRAVAELQQEGMAEAAEVAAALVIDDNEPYPTGQQYLSDFALSYTGEDGAVHISTPGLFHDFESWTSWILPRRIEGQVYCHIATADYMKSLAKGDIQPGTVMTAADDAPTVPR